MRKLLFLLVTAFTLLSCQNDEIISNETSDKSIQGEYSTEVIPGKYVVIYNNDGIKQASKVAALSGSTTIKPEHIISVTKQIFENENIVYRVPEETYAYAVKGVALELSAEEAAELAKSPVIKGV